MAASVALDGSNSSGATTTAVESIKAPPSAFACAMCGDNYDAAPFARCLACQDSSEAGWLCRACFRSHERGVRPGHDAREAAKWDSRAEVLAFFGAATPSQICELHGELVTFWCLDCGDGACAPMCTECAPVHRGHTFYSTAAAAVDVKRELSWLMDEAPLWPQAKPAALKALPDIIQHRAGLRKIVLEKSHQACLRVSAAREIQLEHLRYSSQSASAEMRSRSRAGIERVYRDSLAAIRGAADAKIAALDLETSGAVTALNRISAEVAAVRAALAVLTSVDIVALGAILSVRLRALIHCLGTVVSQTSAVDTTLEVLLPTDLPPRERPEGVDAQTLASAAVITATIQPSPMVRPPRYVLVVTAVRARDVGLQVHTQGGSIVKPGDQVRFALRLTDESNARVITPVPVALATLSVRSAATIIALPPGFREGSGVPVPVPYSVTIDEEADSIVFICTVPSVVAGGGRLALTRLTVNDEPVSGVPLELTTASVTVADVLLKGFGPGLVVGPGATITASLELTPEAQRVPGFSSHPALAFLAARTRVIASIAARRSSVATPLDVAIRADPSESAVSVRIKLPETFLSGAVVTVASVLVDGRPLRGTPFSIEVLSRESAEKLSSGSLSTPSVNVRVLLNLPGAPPSTGGKRVHTTSDFVALADLAARTCAHGAATTLLKDALRSMPSPRRSGEPPSIAAAKARTSAIPLPTASHLVNPCVTVDARRGAVAVSFSVPAPVVHEGGEVELCLGLPA